MNRMQKNPLRILGIVGIRSGSRGLPNKNIRPLSGKPLVGHILDTAKKSKYINKLIVSTDSEKYASIVRKHCAETPFLRPKELALDTSTDFCFVKHAVEWLSKNENYKPDIVVRMMATSPLQTANDIDSCIEMLLKDSRAQSAVVIAEARQTPEKALKIISDNKGDKCLVGYFSGLGKDVNPTLRQNYEKAYFRANVIAFRPEVIWSTNSLTGDIVRYHIIPQERAIDIDSPIDFFIAEKLIEKFRNDNSENFDIV